MKKYLSIILILVINFSQITGILASTNNDKLIIEPIFEETILTYPEDGGEIEYNNVQNFYIYFKTIDPEIINYNGLVKIGNISCKINETGEIGQLSDIYKHYKISCFGKDFTEGLQKIKIGNTVLGEVSLKNSPYKISNSFGMDGYNGLKYSQGFWSIEGSEFHGTNMSYETEVKPDYKIDNGETSLEMSEYNGGGLKGTMSGIPEKAKKLTEKFGIEANLSGEVYTKFLWQNLLKSNYKSLNLLLNDKNALGNFIKYLKLQEQIVKDRIYSENLIYEKGGKKAPKCKVDSFSITSNLIPYYLRIAGTPFDNIVYPNKATSWGDNNCSKDQLQVFNEWLDYKSKISQAQKILIGNYDSYKDYQDKIGLSGNQTDNKAVFDLFRGLDRGINKANAKLLYRDILAFLVNNGYEIGSNFTLKSISPQGYKIAKKSDGFSVELGGAGEASLGWKGQEFGGKVEGFIKQGNSYTYDNENNNTIPEQKNGSNIELEKEFKGDLALTIGANLVDIDKYLTPNICHVIRVGILKSPNIIEYNGNNYEYNIAKQKLYNTKGGAPLGDDKKYLACQDINKDIIKKSLVKISNLSIKGLQDMFPGLDNDVANYIILGLKALVFNINFSASTKYSSDVEYNKDEDIIKISINSFGGIIEGGIDDSNENYNRKEYIFKFRKGTSINYKPSVLNGLLNTISYKDELVSKMKTEKNIEKYIINNYYITSKESGNDNEFGIKMLSYIKGDSTSKKHTFLQYSSVVDTKTLKEYTTSDINKDFDVKQIAEKVLQNESDKDRVFNIYALVYITFFGYNAKTGNFTPNDKNRDGGLNEGISPSKIKELDTYFKN